MLPFLSWDSGLTAWDWIICLSYLAAVFGLGVWFAQKQHNNEDYFLGGRRMHWFPIGLSIFAGVISSLSFVGLPREAAYKDYHLLLGILFIPFVVMPIVGWVFVPLFHRLQVTSCYEYLELRFNRSVRLLASFLFSVYAIMWMGNLLVAVGAILQPVLGLTKTDVSFALIAVGAFATFYTTLGGVKAVVWTDALQAVVLGGGMLAVLLLAVGRIEGGWDQVVQIGQEHNKFAMFETNLSFDKPNFWGACAFGFFVYLAGHAVHFTLVQRYVSMPSISAARWSLVVNSVMIAGVCTLFFLVGTTLFAFYQQTGGAVFEQLQAKDATDQLLPTFVLQEIPDYGLTGLLVAGLFAAAMSSMDSGINSLTATVVVDWLGGREVSLSTSRLLTVTFGVLTIIMALVLQQIGGPVFRMLMTIAGTFLGLLLGVFVLGMFFPWIGARSAFLGLISGSILGTTVIVLSFAGTAYDIESLKPLASGWHWWGGGGTTLSTIFAGLLAGCFFPRSSSNSLAGLVIGYPAEDPSPSKEPLEFAGKHRSP